MPPQFVKPYVKSQKNDAADTDDYAESHSGLPPQTVLDAPGEGGGAHSGLPPQTMIIRLTRQAALLLAARERSASQTRMKS